MMVFYIRVLPPSQPPDMPVTQQLRTPAIPIRPLCLMPPLPHLRLPSSPPLMVMLRLAKES